MIELKEFKNHSCKVVILRHNGLKESLISIFDLLIRSDAVGSMNKVSFGRVPLEEI
jgi:hypothetical protein